LGCRTAGDKDMRLAAFLAIGGSGARRDRPGCGIEQTVVVATTRSAFRACSSVVLCLANRCAGGRNATFDRLDSRVLGQRFLLSRRTCLGDYNNVRQGMA